MSDEPETPGSETSAPYTVIFSRQARRNLQEQLPLNVAAAAMETIDGPLTTSPHRVGKPLDEPFDGYQSARRGTYRIIYRINEDKHTVEIHSIRHRRVQQTVLVAIEEYLSMRETAEILADPAALRSLAEAREAEQAGDVVYGAEAARALLAERMR